MKTPYSDKEVMQVLINYPEFTRADAISYLNERYDEYHDPEGDRELCDMLEEREMESHIEHIRSRGGKQKNTPTPIRCRGIKTYPSSHYI